MSKSIRDYLPSKEVQMVQGRVRKDLVDLVEQIRSNENLTWPQVLTACLQKFVEDMNAKGKKNAS